jgi:hypothetical protein
MLGHMQAKSLVLAALVAIVGACTAYQDGAQAEGTIVAPSNFRAGSGTISGVGVLRNANKDAAAGASGSRPDPNLYRLSLQMDVGGFQQVDVDNSSFITGEAVELTNDGRIVRISGTTLNQLRK